MNMKLTAVAALSSVTTVTQRIKATDERVVPQREKRARVFVLESQAPAGADPA
jgi:hypothetical protein